MKYLLGRLWLFLFGWKVEGERKFPDKFVLIAAPHTSNWDMAFMTACAWVLRVRVAWLGKHTLFRWPLGWLCRVAGGIPVDRRSRQNMVEQIAKRFSDRARLILAVPPEGTRGKVDYWKSGFYHIARTARVPIGLGFLDYRRKRGGIGGLFTPTGDVRADMEKLRAFYKEIRGKFPELEGCIRLREEDAEPQAVAAQG